MQFKDGAANLGAPVTLAAGQASLATTALSVGAHSITAVYPGNATFATSTSPSLAHTVTQAATSTSVVRSVGPNPSTSGQSVTFTATVSATAPGAGTPSGTVQFKDGAANLGVAGDGGGRSGQPGDHNAERGCALDHRGLQR